MNEENEKKKELTGDNEELDKELNEHESEYDKSPEGSSRNKCLPNPITKGSFGLESISSMLERTKEINY